MEDVNRISDLHYSILSHILSFLPIEEAVRTSVLSTRWRYLFSILPNIDLDLDVSDDELRPKNLKRCWTDTDLDSFGSFLDRVLSFDNTHTTKLDKFCLNGRMGVDSNQIYQWISAVVQRGIRHLDLHVFTHQSTTLPDLLLTCRKLTTFKLENSSKFDLYVPKDVYFPNLKTLHLNGVVLVDFDSVQGLVSRCTSLEDMVLSCCRRIHNSRQQIFKMSSSTTLVSLKFDIRCDFDIPKDVHCPNLKTLHLGGVQFLNDDSIKNLLYGCHNLEDMVIIRCRMESESNFHVSHHLLKRLTVIRLYYDGWIIIDAPNLAYFKYESAHLRYSMDNLTSLVKADIDIHTSFGYIFGLNHVVDATPFFSGMSNVRSLILTSIPLENLLSCDPFPVFANLLELEIRYGNEIESKYGWRLHKHQQYHLENGLETLLTSCCELENLAIHEGILCSFPENPSLLSKLKVIKISNFRDDIYCIRKAKYILRNGRALEKLNICTSRKSLYRNYEERAKQQLKISKALLDSPRESEQCCISII